MQQLERQLNKNLFGGFAYAVIMICVGLFAWFNPATSLETIRWILVAVTGLVGLSLVIGDFSRGPSLFAGAGTVLGSLSIIVALLVAFRPEVLNIIPVILGVWILISGVSTLRMSAAVRGSTGSMLLAVLGSLISLIAGVLLIVNPFGGQLAITVLIGIMLVVHGVSLLIDLFVFRARMKDLSAYLKSRARTVNGKEVK